MLTAKQSSDFIARYSRNLSVIPVLVIDEISVAEDIAKTLVDSGAPVIEVTLRTESALKVIEKMAMVSGAIIAAGTVLNEHQVIQSKSAGAQFIVSPGSTDTLINASGNLGMPLLPGVSTASEIMQLAEKGFELLKFFPAEANGGVNALKALSAPFPSVKFCATGGINAENVKEYLSLHSVSVVGGSWLVTEDDIQTRNWKSIAQKVRLVNELSSNNH